MIDFTALKINPKNPRLIKKEQFDKLKKSIGSFTKMLEIRPIAYDEEGVIWGGNMRYEALKSLGIEMKPKYFKELKGFTLEEKREFAIRDNIELGSWDDSILANEWSDLPLEEWGVDTSGWEKEVEEDEAPEVSDEEPISKLGEVYQLGRHRLMCGDSTKIEDVEKLMNGQKAELLFTSPPYSDMRDYSGGLDLSVTKLKSFIELFDSYVNYQAVNLGIQRKNGEVFEYWDEYKEYARGLGLKLLSWNVWYQGTAGSISKQVAFFPIEHEWVFIFGRQFKEINRTEQRATPISRKESTHRNRDGSMERHNLGRQEYYKELGTVLYVPSEKTEIRASHPAVYPIEFAAKYIETMTGDGDSVVDCFGGSGSTLIACEQLNRTCYMMEISPAYCDVIRKRYAKFIGKENEWQTL